MATTDIQITDLTEGTLTGNGIFDKLMAAVGVHLDDQYAKNRITGTDYATVYLGSMQSVIQQSVQYLLQEKQVEASVDLIEQQALTEAQNTLNATKQGILLDTDEQIKEYELANILPKQSTNLSVEGKLALLSAQLGVITELYKNKQLDNLPEIISRETEVESVYNSILADIDPTIAPITVGE